LQTYRSQVKIVVDVLTSANAPDADAEGVGITHLLRRANLSYTRLLGILSKLVDHGLLNETNLGRTQKYRISDKGLKFLRAYGEFEEFTESFGLRV